MRILVKSDPEYFDKEKKEIKPFTVRTLDGNDIINITNTKTGEWFEKVITDISIYKDLIMISFKSKKSIKDPEIKPQPITPSIDEPVKKQEEQPKPVTEKVTKTLPQKTQKKTGTPTRPDKDKIINFIRTREHTLEEIQIEFELPTLTSVYYWLSQAKVKPRDLPKKKKIVIVPKIEHPEEEEFKEPDPEDYDRGN